MNDQNLSQLLQAIAAASIDDEKRRIVQNHPELLTEETLAQIWEMGYALQDEGHTQTANFHFQLATSLGELREQTLPDPEQEIPLADSPSTQWARLYRQCWALSKHELLDEALREAAQASEPNVEVLIRAILSDDFQTVHTLAPALQSALQQQGHIEEANTVALTHLCLFASQLEYLDQIPIPQPAAVFKMCFEYCQQAITIARLLPDRPCEAKLSSLLGRGYSFTNRLSESESAYSNALTIYEELAASHPEVYQQYVAITQNDLGQVFYDLHHLLESEAAFRASLTIYEKLASLQPKVYASDVAMAQNNLGKVLGELRRLSESESAFRAAITIYEELAVSNPDVHQRYVAITQNNLGNVLSDLHRLPESESAFRVALTIYEKLAASEPAVYASNVAVTQTNLGNVLHAFRRLSESETAYRAALAIQQKLSVSEPKVHAPDVASTQGNLGGVLHRLQLLRESETAYRAALTIYEKLAASEPEIYASDVARTQHNLGGVLSALNRLGESETAYRAALTIYKKLADVQPEVYAPDVATTQSSLGNMLRELHRLPESEAAIRTALTTYEELASLQPEVYAPNVAQTQNNLGIVFSDLRRFLESESAFRAALTTYEELASLQPKVYAPDVAITQNNLGNVLRDLRRFLESESAYRVALAIYEKLAASEPAVYVSNVAMTQTNLGNALSALNRLGESETAHRAALTIYKKLADVQPEVYESYVANTQNNLGAVLHKLDRFPESETAYHAALAIRQKLVSIQPEIYESHLAQTQNNIGNVLRDLHRLSESETAYHDALTIYRRYDVPNDCATLLNNLGRLLLDQQHYEEAVEYLQQARSLTERLRAEVHNQERQRQIVSDNFSIFENLMLALMKLGRFAEALEVAEQGKSRTLIDLMASRDMEPRGASPDLVARYRQALAQVRGLQRQPETSAPITVDATYRHYESLLREIQFADPDFLPRAQPLTHAQILDIAREADSTLVLFRVTEKGTFVFLVFADGHTEVVEVPSFTAIVLDDLIAHFEGEGENRRVISGWLEDYARYRDSRSPANLTRWQDTMDSVLGKLHDLLITPVREKLRTNKPTGSNRLVLVPNRALAILPLHACYWWEDGEQVFWFDEYHIRYTPNLFIFKRALAQEKKLRSKFQNSPDSLLGVINPTQDLKASMWEGEQIHTLVGTNECIILLEEKATREAFDSSLGAQRRLHFACHGLYNPAEPLDSALMLAGADFLSLGEIFQSLNVPEAWLVVLSACETSLVDWRDAADEHYGLATGFLYAGTPTVYATLWAVQDGSTALMMTHAYELLQTSRDKVQVLRETQQWLRGLTIKNALLALPDSPYADSMRDYLQGLLERGIPSTYCPFGHPMYWAAFQCVGV